MKAKIHARDFRLRRDGTPLTMCGRSARTVPLANLSELVEESVTCDRCKRSPFLRACHAQFRGIVRDAVDGSESCLALVREYGLQAEVEALKEDDAVVAELTDFAERLFA